MGGDHNCKRCGKEGWAEEFTLGYCIPCLAGILLKYEASLDLPIDFDVKGPEPHRGVNGRHRLERASPTAEDWRLIWDSVDGEIM